ncbi:hypothetical protein [Metabacillus fastidiosus]|uniref:hypothetical protein n=1 Tax=Metabacillus fastidiosus TaxID=1458 RepID=UPI002DBFD682|nr:hypothetical protein [Metabacillus fastidiosus]MEC2077766.1 hypothetical protein [Metabacillus fastidiosus]
MRDEEKKILFLEEYGPEDDGISAEVFFEKWSKESRKLDWNDLMPKQERYRVETLEWYRNLPIEKKFKILDANIDMEDWNDLMFSCR